MTRNPTPYSQTNALLALQDGDEERARQHLADYNGRELSDLEAAADALSALCRELINAIHPGTTVGPGRGIPPGTSPRHTGPTEPAHPAKDHSMTSHHATPITRHDPLRTSPAVAESAEAPAARLDMDEIIRVIRQDHGIYAHLEDTGGRCAAIYAGARDKDGHFQVAAGPGLISWDPKVASTGHLGDFYVGPDDEGNTPATDVTKLGATTEAGVAELIVRLVRTGSVQPPTTTSTGRGRAIDEPHPEGRSTTYLDSPDHVWELDPAAGDDFLGALAALEDRTIISASERDLILRGTAGLLERGKGTFAQCLTTSLIWYYG